MATSDDRSAGPDPAAKDLAARALAKATATTPAPFGPGFVTLAGVAGVAVLAMIFLVFVVAPQERTMGIVQKIFYIHVPSAVVMNLTVVMCAIASVLFLITSNRRFD